MGSRRSAATTVSAAVLAGCGGALVGASFDAIAASPQLVRFFGYGVWTGGSRLWLFLLSLYGAAFASIFAVVALLVGLLFKYTLAGAWWDAENPAARPAVAWFPAILATVIAATALGLTLYPLALLALVRFHHLGLIALLVGTAALGLSLLYAALGFSVMALFPTPPEGRGIRVQFRGPRDLYAVGWALGLIVICGGVNLLLIMLQKNPRMTPAMRALNLSLWTPPLALFTLGFGHFVGRMLAARSKRASDSNLEPSFTTRLLRPLLMLLVPALLIALGYREVLGLVNLRPLLTVGIGALVAVSLLGPFLKIQRRGWLLVLLVPPLLYGSALRLGANEKVRKAALALAPLSEQLVIGLSTIGDLDGDGSAGTWAIGGSDCDDLDPERHPGAFDWPNNGIDENCNGHDAKLPQAPVASASGPTPLPSGLISRPNILLITVDALRADHIGAYGYARPTTPVLDKLAQDADAVLFESAWAHAPSTRYSVPAILTGRYPSTIAWGPPHVHWPPEVLPENRLLSEMLAERGYTTAALLSYHYFERGWGLGQGFRDYDTHLMSLHSMGGDPAATSGSSARELADLGIAKLATLSTATEERPFFLWMHFYDPHYRYEAHDPPAGQQAFGNSEIDLYDGEIRYTDAHIGRVLEALQKTPAWARTMVIVTADHGEGFGEHAIGPDRRHGYHLYANQTKVPLIIRWPGLRVAYPSAPRRIAVPVGHVDVAPTALQVITGHDPRSDEPQLLGRSLLPVVTQGAAALADDKAVVFQEVMYEGPTVRKALVSSRWHLIQNLVPDGTSELYDLTADPQEEQDVFGQHPDVEKDLQARLAAWIDDSAVPTDFARRVAGNLSSSPLSAKLPIEARIGDYLDVLAADVPIPQVARGERAEVAVIYRARRRIPAGYRLFVHLRGADGRFLNADHDLLDGLMAPERLRPGLYVRDVMRLAIPPWFSAGPASLLVGLFRRDSRVEVEGPEDKILRKERAVRVATLDIH